MSTKVDVKAVDAGDEGRKMLLMLPVEEMEMKKAAATLTTTTEVDEGVGSSVKDHDSQMLLRWPLSMYDMEVIRVEEDVHQPNNKKFGRKKQHHDNKGEFVNLLSFVLNPPL